MRAFDIIVAGGGPGGLSAAEAAARNGASVLVLERGDDIGSPVRTSGGSFIKELDDLGIPSRLYHPIHRCRFVSPANSATFTYPKAVACVMDVRGVYQHLAERAADAGASIQTGSTAVQLLMERGAVTGLVTKSRLYGDETIQSSIVVDATGHRALLMKQAGVHGGFGRFGVGSEFDLYAPHYDESEAVLIVGNQVAPAGYAWALPWGRHRVRVGVGIIHGDSTEHPDAYLRRLCADGDRWGMNLRGAQPIEYHFGLIPSDGLPESLVADGIMGTGDAAGQASTLVGEGIRWAMRAGQMAGIVAAEAIAHRDYSAEYLRRYEKQWRSEFGRSLRIAHEINKRIAGWNDAKWDLRLDLLKQLSAAQFAQALKTDFTAGFLWNLIRSNPKLMRDGLRRLITGRDRPGNRDSGTPSADPIGHSSNPQSGN